MPKMKLMKPIAVRTKYLENVWPAEIEARHGKHRITRAVDHRKPEMFNHVTACAALLEKLNVPESRIWSGWIKFGVMAHVVELPEDEQVEVSIGVESARP